VKLKAGVADDSPLAGNIASHRYALRFDGVEKSRSLGPEVRDFWP
jgi:hypothetical protein